MSALFAATFTAVALLVWAERARSRWGVALWKTLASAGFVAVGLRATHAAGPAELALLAGLVACALGDVFLIPAGANGWFLAGMASFALGHLAYTAAFIARGLALLPAFAALLAMGAVLFFVLRWLGPHLPVAMRVPVRGYMAIIACMVAAAVGRSAASGELAPCLGALAFAASDLSVARERFVRPSFVNVCWGLPLYYAAQLVLAWAGVS